MLVAVEEAWLGGLGADEGVGHLVQGDDGDAVLGELVWGEGGGEGGGDLSCLEGVWSRLGEAYQLKWRGRRGKEGRKEEGGKGGGGERRGRRCADDQRLYTGRKYVEIIRK